MANVSMDLAELKQLENKIEELTADKKDLLDKQHQVVVYHKYFNGKVRPGSNPKNKNVEVNSISIVGSYTQSWEKKYFSNIISIADALEAGLVEIDLTEDSSKHTKDYKNMSEVISEIRQEEKIKVDNELQECYERATNAEYNSSVIEDKYKKKILESTDFYNGRIKELTTTIEENKNKHDEVCSNIKAEESKKYNKLLKEFQDFKEDKEKKEEVITFEKTIQSLKSTIENLNKKLNSYKNKTYFQKIFNI